MTNIRSPQKNQQHDQYSNNSKASRKAIPRSKQLANSTARQKMNHQLRTCVDYDELDTTDANIGKWKKVHDAPLGAIVPTKSDLARRAIKDRAHMDLDMQFAHQQLTKPEPMFTTEDVEHYTRNNTEFE